MSLKDEVQFLALATILFSATILAILVQGHIRNISVKLFFQIEPPLA